MSNRTVLEMGPGALADYYDWYKDASHGDVLVYHEGDLQFDRDPSNYNAVQAMISAGRIDALNNVSNRIRSDAKDGYLILTQKRLGPSRFEYRAVRKRSEMEQGFASKKVRDGDLVLA